MKSIFCRTLKSVGLAGVMGCLAAGVAFAEPVATLDNIQGEVMIQPAGAAPDAWQPVSAGTPLNSGDSVKTVNGSCLIVYSDIASVTVEPNTSITVQEMPETQDILLKLGKLNAKINKEKVVKPFQVVTPTAIGAVRGTDVDFDFNEEGLLTVDLHDGNLHVYNDEAGMTLDLVGGNKIKILYDAEKGILKIQNDCGSTGAVTFNVLGTEYSENPCEEKEIALETALGPSGNPEPPKGDDPENPRDDIPQDSSPTTPV